MSAVALHDDGWAIRALPPGRRDLGCHELWERSLARSRRRRAQAERRTGLPVRAVKLIAVHDRDRHNFPPHVHHIFKLFFLVEETGEPHGEPDEEIDEIGWFRLDDLPPLSTGRASRDQVELALAHAEHPERPTDFD